MSGKWSKWICGILHEPKDGWFTRNEEAFASLPTKVGGVYLIGVGKRTEGPEAEPDRVVYCGRALATEAGGGTSLRSRLYSGYAKSGSHLHVKMRLAMEGGNDVYFKWMILDTREKIVDTEAEMIEKGSYIWNKVQPSKSKKFIEELEKLVGGDETKLQLVREWILQPKRIPSLS